ncbi:uncharacterized protein LOC9659607 [Selaginella moellendorffii]|nr:uncharacterized protein LOC9659607 [Selaginella moellendorffii]|eukprot:XP_002978983.2 uncharacterized protein LOC9659607 [Selaginella moellendorffii]
MGKRTSSASTSGAGAVKKLKLQGQDLEVSNVELMGLLRLSSTPNSSKLDQAFQFVESQKKGSLSRGVPMPQFVSFLAGWIQSEIISSAKPGSKDKGGNVTTDARSWAILHWCLSSQGNLHVYPGILKGIDLVLTTKGMRRREGELVDSNESEELEVVVVSVIEILKLLLHTYDRSFRPQLLDWTLFASSFFEALLRSELERSMLETGALIADGFGKFLTTQANPKAAFQAIVEKLLCPLLKLTGVLIYERKGCDAVELLRTAIARVLDYGLFHTVPIEGFPEASTAAAKWLNDSSAQEMETTSSHKLLFEKLKELGQERSFTALASLGELLRLFAPSFKGHRASIKSDVFGVRGVGQQDGSEEKENQQGGEDGESKSVRLTDNQQQFLVFVELSLPLIQQLIDEKEVSGKTSLVTAISSLFRVAKEQVVYVPTRDTPTNGHFKFIKQYYGVLVDYAKSLSAVNDSGMTGLIAAGYGEIVRGIGVVLDIDHRAAEGGVKDFWRILLSATVIETSEVADVIAVGCQMLRISSELRDLGALPVLFSSVKSLGPDEGLQFLSPSLFAQGLKSFFCDPLLLNALRKMIENMPEAQAPEVVNMVSRDALETLRMINSTDVVVEAVVMASGELHAQILENLNITSTNAYQVGVNVRQLVNSVVAEPLFDLLVKISKGKVKKLAEWAGLKAFFLLRLYLICRMLHRQCISLMAPLKAGKAAEAAHELHLDSLEIDWMEIALEPQDLSTFSWIGQATSVTALINGLLLVTRKKSFPSLYYLMDLLAIQRLSDLQRYIQSVEYFEAKLTSSSVEDPVLHSLDSVDYQNGKSSSEGDVRQLLLDFKAEAKDLVVLLLDGGTSCSLKEIGETVITSWNGVVVMLTEESMPSARWQLISRTIDLWSRYASRKCLTSCLSYALITWRPEPPAFAQRPITRELLHNLLFCENQRVQTALLPAAWKALRKLLHLEIEFKKFKKPSFTGFESSTLNIQLLPDSTLETCIGLFQLIASFPWGQKKELDTMQCIFSVCYVERLALSMLAAIIKNRSEISGVKIFELFAVCRQTTKAFAITRSKQIGSDVPGFDMDLFSWLYRSINMASDCAMKLKERSAFVAESIGGSLASAVKSTQSYIQHILNQIFALESSCLLVKRSEARAESVDRDDDTKFLFKCIQQADSAWDADDNELQSYSFLGSISFARSLLWTAAETLGLLDRKCQEDKSRELRWLTTIPWVSSLRSIEQKVVTMLLGRIAEARGTESRQSSILDVFLDSKNIDVKALKVETLLEDQEDDESTDESDSEKEEQEDEGKSETSSDDEDPKVEPAQDIDMEEVNVQADETSQLHPLDESQKAALSWLFDSGLQRERSEIVGELLMAMAALVKLRSLHFSPYALKASSIGKTAARSTVSAVLEVVYSLLTEATSLMYHAAPAKRTCFFWIFGAVKCMESLGLVLPSLQPPLARAEYLRLLTLHIDLLGAVIWLQSSEIRADFGRFYGDLGAAIRDSFCALIKFAPVPQLLLAFQTIQKALCGSSDVSKFSSALRLGDCDDGRVGVVTAACVECLAVALDAVSGPRRLKVLAKYSPRFIAELVNLITHLQGPAVFYKKKRQEERPATVASSSVLLQSLDIITRIASREVIFSMKATHVALALHSPVGILKPVYQFKLPSYTKHRNPRFKIEDGNVDAEVVLHFYIASCKLLYTVLKHRKRESGRAIALLGESLRVLLHCLESSSKLCTMTTQCARWLRRIYEELGEQKETLGRYCINVLSDYLSVLSGAGPFEAGLDREVDKELRPGVYALLSSSQDLQQLHATLGEGPLRSNLAMIRKDYEKNFKYTGKI